MCLQKKKEHLYGHWMCSKLGLYMPLTLLNKVIMINNNCFTFYLDPSNTKKKVLNKGEKI